MQHQEASRKPSKRKRADRRKVVLPAHAVENAAASGVAIEQAPCALPQRGEKNARLSLCDASSAAGVRDGPPPPEWKTVGIFHYDPDRIHPRQIRRLQEIAAFFTETNVTRILVPVAKAEFDVSLRILDYCCTNYAKKTRVVICEDRKSIHLFSLYKDWLRHYRRRTFDPFRRRERICFQSPSPATEWLETTVAQLNFLRWADVYGVIRYVRRNLQQIEKDMMTTLLDSKQRRHSGAETRQNVGTRSAESSGTESGKRKRTELSRHPSSKCVVYLVPQSVLFEEE